MQNLLIKYGVPVLIIIAVVASIYGLGYSAGKTKGKELEHIALASQKTQLARSCADDKNLTHEVSNEFQKAIASIDDQLANELRTGSTYSIVSVADARSGHNATTEGQQSHNRVEIPRAATLEYAATCERDRQKVISLQEFIKRTWSAKGQ